MSRNAFPNIEREYAERQALREHAATERQAATEFVLRNQIKDFSDLAYELLESLEWAIRRIEISGLGEGEYFAKAKTVLDRAVALRDRD